ncbi:MAG: PstS family phosphate ABC transporter substrate-binding protein, partial [Candidatus Methylomirabilis sp.]|nr:PstS family phosphate ABC transporter substrate-binding protein [Deltaproteobacteria bacterium]
GFKKFCNGETDISDASRPIKASEAKACSMKKVQYIELPVAYDGLSVLVNPSNDFATSLTVAELTRIWKHGGAQTWKDVRSEWPDRKIDLYGPGTDSGTFDYFVEAILPAPNKIRSDFTASEDDNVLVQGIAGSPDALGFFGYAYYVENQDKLKAVAIDGGKGPVSPSLETVKGGTYQPLSRPIFIYIGVKAAERPEIQEFVKFYLKNAGALVQDVGYIPLPDKAYELALKRFEDRVAGTVFKGAEVGVTVEDLLSREE